MLLFQPAEGTWGDFAPIPQGYGNRVVAETQDGFRYGLDGGITPNVVVQHSTDDLPQLYAWNNDFGDLQHVAIAQEPRVFEIDLVADDGYLVTLNSFDMAAWPHLDYTINSVLVLDGDYNVLYYQENVPIYGDPGGPQHTHFDFNGVSGNKLWILFDATNVDSDDIGITNINFSQDGGGSSPNHGSTSVPPRPQVAVPKQQQDRLGELAIYLGGTLSSDARNSHGMAVDLFEPSPFGPPTIPGLGGYASAVSGGLGYSPSAAVTIGFPFTLDPNSRASDPGSTPSSVNRISGVSDLAERLEGHPSGAGEILGGAGQSTTTDRVFSWNRPS